SQKASSSSGMQTHWFSSQRSSSPQVPQVTVRSLPQLSSPVSSPQAASCLAQKAASVSSTQELTHWPASQCSPSSQVPQVTVRSSPQLSSRVTSPQTAPARWQRSASDSGTHATGHSSPSCSQP